MKEDRTVPTHRLRVELLLEGRGVKRQKLDF